MHDTVNLGAVTLTCMLIVFSFSMLRNSPLCGQITVCLPTNNEASRSTWSLMSLKKAIRLSGRVLVWTRFPSLLSPSVTLNNVPLSFRPLGLCRPVTNLGYPPPLLSPQLSHASSHSHTQPRGSPPGPNRSTPVAPSLCVCRCMPGVTLRGHRRCWVSNLPVSTLFL